MNKSSRFARFQLIGWLAVSHLLAALVAACFIYLAPAGWSAAGQVLAGILFGLAAGLLLSMPIRRAVQTAEAALAKLAHGQAIAALPAGWERAWGPLAGLLELVDSLGAREPLCRDWGDRLVAGWRRAAWG